MKQIKKNAVHSTAERTAKATSNAATNKYNKNISKNQEPNYTKLMGFIYGLIKLYFDYKHDAKTTVLLIEYFISHPEKLDE